MAKQTRDEDDRQRYLRLQQMYLQLIEAEERAGSPMAPATRESGIKPAA